VVQQDKAAKINQMIMSLDRPSIERLEALNSNLAEVTRLMDWDSSGTVDFIKETKQESLRQLSNFFLQLLVTRNLAMQSLKRTNPEELRSQIETLKKQLETPNISEALSRSVMGTLEIQEKRLENFKKAQENLQVVEMELNRIENQVQLIREEIAINRTPEAISSSIDRINTTLGETEEWMKTHSDFFSRISGDTETIVSGPPLPPKIPQAQ